MSETVAVFNGEKMTRREIEIAREAFMRGGQFAFSKIREARIGVDYHRDGEWIGLIPEAARRFPVPTITRPRVMRDPHESGLRWTVRDGKIAIYDSDHIPCRSPSNERVALWASLLEDPNETVDDES